MVKKHDKIHNFGAFQFFFDFVSDLRSLCTRWLSIRRKQFFEKGSVKFMGSVDFGARWRCFARMTREGLKLRIMGTFEVQMKLVVPWLVRWTRCAGARYFYSALAALVSPVQTIIFLTAHFLLYVSASPSNLGRKSCRVACLLICVSGCDLFFGLWHG